MAQEGVANPDVSPEKARSPEQGDQAGRLDSECEGAEEQREKDQHAIDSRQQPGAFWIRCRRERSHAGAKESPDGRGVVAMIEEGCASQMWGPALEEGLGIVSEGLPARFSETIRA